MLRRTIAQSALPDCPIKFAGANLTANGWPQGEGQDARSKSPAGREISPFGRDDKVDSRLEPLLQQAITFDEKIICPVSGKDINGFHKSGGNCLIESEPLHVVPLHIVLCFEYVLMRYLCVY